MDIATGSSPPAVTAASEPARTTAHVYLLCCVASLGGLLFGFDTAVIAGTVPFLRSYFTLAEASLGWAVSCVLVGCVIGSAVAGQLSDRFGRKPVLVVTAAFFALSALGSAVATSFALFVWARILGGLAVGAASMVAPVYIAEIAPADHRGRLVSLYQLAIVVGILVAFFSNYVLANIGSESWRWMLGVETLPALVFLLLLFLVSESPRWLARRDPDSARKVLARGQGEAIAERELSSILELLAGENRGRPTDLLDRRLRPLLLVGIGLAIFQQVTGINVIMYYAPLLLESTGLGTGNALLQTVAIGAVNLGFTVVAIRLVDRLGRRPLLLAGSAMMGLALLSLALAFYLDMTRGPLVLLSILLYIASFAASLGPVVWVVNSEIFPVKVRGVAVSVATFVLWLSNFVVTLTFPWLLSNLRGGHTFLLYALVCTASFLFVWRRVPETRGRSLEEIERELVGTAF